MSYVNFVNHFYSYNMSTKYLLLVDIFITILIYYYIIYGIPQ